MHKEKRNSIDLLKMIACIGIVVMHIRYNISYEIPGDLLDDNQKENAVRIKYPKLLRTALSDDLNNEFESSYLAEVSKYKSI